MTSHSPASLDAELQPGPGPQGRATPGSGAGVTAPVVLRSLTPEQTVFEFLPPRTLDGLGPPFLQ